MVLEHSKKYTFRFIDDKKIVIAKTAQESEFQPFAKALVYALYHKEYPSLRVQAKFDDRFQPDLSAVDYDGTVLLWAECGNVSLNKVEKLFKKYRQARFVFVKELRDIPAFERNFRKQLKDIRVWPAVDIVIYPEHFQEWNVSEEGDVYIDKEDVSILRWAD